MNIFEFDRMYSALEAWGGWMRSNPLRNLGYPSVSAEARVFAGGGSAPSISDDDAMRMCEAACALNRVDAESFVALDYFFRARGSYTWIAERMGRDRRDVKTLVRSGIYWVWAAVSADLIYQKNLNVKIIEKKVA